jgi:hypothetical protein
MLEDDLDETLGPALRAAIVTPLFRHDPDIALRVLTTGMGSKAYRTLRPLLRVFPSFYRFRHRISENNLEQDRIIVAAALDRIEHERQNRAYLVGAAFSVADLTAAALLSVLLQPPEIQYPLPPGSQRKLGPPPGPVHQGATGGVARGPHWAPNVYGSRRRLVSQKTVLGALCPTKSPANGQRWLVLSVACEVL